MKNSLIISAITALLIICFVRCSNSDNSPTDETVISLFTDFKIMNSKGEDLLNPNTEGAFDQQKIRIKHLTKNGDFVMFYKSFLACPYDFVVYTTIYDKTNTFALLNQVTNDYHCCPIKRVVFSDYSNF